MAAGVVSPKEYPIRKPTDASQMNGRNVNPVRYGEIASISASRWDRDTGQPRNPQKNVAKVEAPAGGVAPGKRSKRDSD